MVQKEPGEGEKQVDIVMLTHRALEKNVNAAIGRIERLATVVGRVRRIRVEELL
jgi:homoserine dehydrogenase